MAGTWRQELMRGPWRRAAYWLVHHDLLALLPNKTLLASPGMAPPRMGAALSHQSVIKKMPYSQMFSICVWCIYIWFYTPIKFPLSSSQFLLPSIPPPTSAPLLFFITYRQASHSCQSAMVYQVVVRIGTFSSSEAEWMNYGWTRVWDPVSTIATSQHVTRRTCGQRSLFASLERWGHLFLSCAIWGKHSEFKGPSKCWRKTLDPNRIQKQRTVINTSICRAIHLYMCQP